MESDSGSESAATSELLTAIGMALSEIATQNDCQAQETQETEVLTFFHAFFVPQISVAEYVQRLRYYCQCSPECFIIAVIFLDRFLAAAPYIRLSSRTAHRLIVTAVLLAVKAIDDDYFRNTFYAHVGGISVGELNRMELVFLRAIDFNLFVSPDVYDTFRERLRWYLVDHAVTVDSQTPYPCWAAPAAVGCSTDDSSTCQTGTAAPSSPSPPGTVKLSPCTTTPSATGSDDAAVTTLWGSHAASSGDRLDGPLLRDSPTTTVACQVSGTWPHSGSSGEGHMTGSGDCASSAAPMASPTVRDVAAALAVASPADVMCVTSFPDTLSASVGTSNGAISGTRGHGGQPTDVSVPRESAPAASHSYRTCPLAPEAGNAAPAATGSSNLSRRGTPPRCLVTTFGSTADLAALSIALTPTANHAPAAAMPSSSRVAATSAPRAAAFDLSFGTAAATSHVLPTALPPSPTIPAPTGMEGVQAVAVRRAGGRCEPAEPMDDDMRGFGMLDVQPL